MGTVHAFDGRRRLTDEQVARAIELRREGESYAAIGKLFGMSAPGVQAATDHVLMPERAAERAKRHAKSMNRSRLGGAPRKADRTSQKPEHRLQTNAEYMRNRREGRKALILRLKSVPCADCKNDFHHAAMHFDHLPGTEKRFNIGERYAHVSEQDLLDEIAKCEVVCANCHAVRTFNRRIV